MKYGYEKDALLESIGARVRALRLGARLTIKELAERAALSSRFVMQLEAGQGNISIARLAQLADALERSLQELIPPASGDGSLSAQIWHLLSRCSEDDLQKLRQWLVARVGAQLPRFIALIGLRGAGKSTVGAQLARRLKTEFVEVDALIEKAAGISLGELFALHGEEYYRRLEREVLSRLFADSRGCVLATGGSIVTDAESWGMVKRQCFTVWLQATPQEHMTRVLRQGDTRPMKDNPSAMAELKALLARREPLYAQADMIVRTSNKSPAAVVAHILKELPSSDPGY
jgi:XRE family aerobic/anaerobic benzoate catabolism transcriptional regulator